MCNRPTNRRTDMPSYRDARTHLKKTMIMMMLNDDNDDGCSDDADDGYDEYDAVI